MDAAVVDTTANTIVVEDLTSDLFKALGPEGRPIASFVIFAFNDSKQANAPTYQTHGTWTSAPSYASSQTTFTDADADDNGGGFASWMIGSILVPDVNIGAPLIITGATATTLTVAGDARGVAANGSQYIVYAAPFTDPVRGTWQTDLHRRGTRYLWAGYRYQPPQMGFWVDPPGAPVLGVYGASTGTNRLGQYYCWNRTYDINFGRWTTPDPVATPWWNLGDYAASSPAQIVDPSGLHIPRALADPTFWKIEVQYWDCIQAAGDDLHLLRECERWYEYRVRWAENDQRWNERNGHYRRESARRLKQIDDYLDILRRHQKDQDDEAERVRAGRERDARRKRIIDEEIAREQQARRNRAAGGRPECQTGVGNRANGSAAKDCTWDFDCLIEEGIVQLPGYAVGAPFEMLECKLCFAGLASTIAMSTWAGRSCCTACFASPAVSAALTIYGFRGCCK